MLKNIPVGQTVEQVSPRARTVFKTAAYSIALSDLVVNCTANTATNSYSVTLPSVSEAEGQEVTVRATIANSKAVTLQDRDDSQGWTDKTLDADGDYITLKSNGRRWLILVNGIA